MYARFIKLVLGPNTRWEAERIADVFSLFLKQQQGFRGVTFLADYENGEYCSLTYWDSQEDLMTSIPKVKPLLYDMIGSCYQWEPSIQVYEVYEPRTPAN